MGQNITIRIGEYQIEHNVASPEEEELIRKAASEVTQKLRNLQSRFPQNGISDILSVLALKMCMSNIALRDRLKSVEAEADGLASEIEGYLESIDKNGR